MFNLQAFSELPLPVFASKKLVKKKKKKKRM